MDISAGLIAKTAAGAAAASATAAGIIYKDEIGSLFSKSKINEDQSKQGAIAGGGGGPTNHHLDSSETEGEDNLTQWDKELIKEVGNSGIQFTSTPEGLKDTFEGEDLVITTTLSVSISDSKFPGLKKLNKNQNWTWECEIVFKKGNTNGKVLEENLKGIFKKFLEKIKSPEDENKTLKIEFIKRCAGFRGEKASNALKTLNDLSSWSEEVKRFDQDGDVVQKDNKIRSEKEFTLADDGKVNSNKLKIEGDKRDEFDQWFSVS